MVRGLTFVDKEVVEHNSRVLVEVDKNPPASVFFALWELVEEPVLG